MSKSDRIKKHQAEELLQSIRRQQIQQQSIDDYILWGKSKPQWGYAIDLLNDTKPNTVHKVGDSGRGWLGPYYRFFEEWGIKFPNSVLKTTFPLMFDETHYIRDYYLHRELTRMKFDNLTREELYELFNNPDAFSKEVFRCSVEDVRTAWENIIKMWGNGTIDRSQVYTIKDSNKPKEQKFWVEYRPNQEAMINKIEYALSIGRRHLLSCSCPRFGKSITTVGAAEKLGLNTALVLSAVANVADEWRGTVENVLNFCDKWVFVDAKMLDANPYIVDEYIKEGKKVLLFLTLQDIQGENVKTRHSQVIKINYDMMVVDETHLGARAESFSAKINSKNTLYDDEFDGLTSYKDNELLLDYVNKNFKSDFQLHLSGTPYNIMLTDEFAKEDIVSLVSYVDILNEKHQWFIDNPDKREDENPYFDFPELLNISIILPETDSIILKKMKELGLGEFTDILNCVDEKTGKLVYSDLAYLFFAAIFGINPDNGIYSFFSSSIIQQKIETLQCAMILSSLKAVDAVNDFLLEHAEEFKIKDTWEIYKATGKKSYMKASQVKECVSEAYKNKKNTLTLTVGKMMVGVTVKEWNCIINARPSSDKQFYDQSLSRSLSGFSKDIIIVSPDGQEIHSKQCLKQQSIFIDLVPNRSIEMSAQKAELRSFIKNKTYSNQSIEDELYNELAFMPQIIPQVMTDNISTLFVPVTHTNIMQYIANTAAKQELSVQIGEFRSVNKDWFENDVVGEYLDELTFSNNNNSKDQNIILDAFQSKDGIFSNIDPDDMTTLSALLPDAIEYGKKETRRTKKSQRRIKIYYQ